MAEQEKMKRCPFCGNRAGVVGVSNVKINGDNEYCVECEACGGCGPEGDTKEEAITQWNRCDSPADWMGTERWLAIRGYADSRPHSSVVIATLIQEYVDAMRVRDTRETSTLE